MDAPASQLFLAADFDDAAGVRHAWRQEQTPTSKTAMVQHLCTELLVAGTPSVWRHSLLGVPMSTSLTMLGVPSALGSPLQPPWLSAASAGGRRRPAGIHRRTALYAPPSRSRRCNTAAPSNARGSPGPGQCKQNSPDSGNRQRPACHSPLPVGAGPAAASQEVLVALANTFAGMQPLYASLVSRQPLTAEEWALVPSPCPCLGAALPAVLGRSAAEAALLVGHLLAAERQRLRTAATCLARAQPRSGASLPSPIVGRILALAAVPP